jgi:thiol:disulfide interchange protein DsbD
MTAFRCSLLSLFLATTLMAVPAANSNLPTQNLPKGHVRAELVGESSTIAPGQPFTVSLHFKIAPHWHTYWRNPGDAGLATKLTWSLPPGFTVSDLQWPAPKRLNVAKDTVNFGYENEVWHLVTVTPPKDLPLGKPVTLTAKAEWLECEDICVPGEADLQLKLAVGDKVVPSPQFDAIQAAKQLLPIQDSNTFKVRAERGEKILRLIINSPYIIHTLNFFPYDDTIIENSAKQTLTGRRGTYSLDIPLAENIEKFNSLSGVLVSDTPWNTSSKTLEFTSKVIIDNTPAVQFGGFVTELDFKTFLFTLVLGFLGGLILNLMPCVFPVLGIKILGFVNQAGQDHNKIIRHGLSFTAGVLVSFWLLAGLLIALRAGGQQLGWGFQLQSAPFVYTLTVILFLFGLNLSGVFEIGTSLIGLGGNRAAGNHLSGSFFSGVLATVVATPCAAPFLATALGTALTLTAIPSLALFTAIALGLATPYLVISARPQLLRFLPRPGGWMESFKQLLAFPLYASAAFLVWVLAAQVADTAFLKILLSLALLGMAVWIYGRWARPDQPANRRIVARPLALLLLASGLFTGWPKAANADSAHLDWQKWSPEFIEKLRAENKPIYLDFTARWCATCQTNKALVFSSKEVLERFKQLGVVPVRADWTNQDPLITRELAKYGKSAVPFNLLYLPNKDNPIQLPEILTPQIVLVALKNSG